MSDTMDRRSGTGFATPCPRRPTYSISAAVGAVIEAVNELESTATPLLAQRQGGVAERSSKYCEASEYREDGVVFRLNRKVTPSAPNCGGCATFYLWASAHLVIVRYFEGR
jgi:hypothetical protein